VLRPHDGILLSTTGWKDLEDTQGSTTCDPFDRKRPEQENPQAGSELMGARGWGEGEASFGGEGMFWN
jgi:hypothetical protein